MSSKDDYRAVVYLSRKERNQNDLAYEVVVYRRGVDRKLVLLFLKPKSEAGKGYLRIEKNLFSYDPTVGNWERRTERERIGGTDSRRADFDESHLAADYTAEYVAQETLGRYEVHRLRLAANAGADVAYPAREVWIDKASGNLLKMQDFALSGKLMRTSYYPTWQQLKSPTTGKPVYVPKEIRILDEVEKGNETVIQVKQVDLSPLEDTLFTKAWLESKSR